MNNNKPVNETPRRVPYILAAAIMGLLGLAGFGTLLRPGPIAQSEASVEAAPAAPAENQPAEPVVVPNVAKPEVVRADDSPTADIELSFKLDLRLTRSLYMGDRWVSPPTYTRAGTKEGCIIEAKARAVDAQANALLLTPEWISADPAMLTVSPGEGKEFNINVQRAGVTSLAVTSPGFTKRLAIKATEQNGVLVVEISQPVVQKNLLLAKGPPTYENVRSQAPAPGPKNPVQTARPHRHRRFPAPVSPPDFVTEPETASAPTASSPQASNSQ